jgi:hypothetical protein
MNSSSRNGMIGSSRTTAFLEGHIECSRNYNSLKSALKVELWPPSTSPSIDHNADVQFEIIHDIADFQALQEMQLPVGESY